MRLDNLSGAALLQLKQLLESGDSREVAKAIKAVYEDIMREYRPTIEALPEIAALIGKDVTPVLTAGLKAFNSVGDDKKLQTELAKFRKRRAEARFKIMKSYTDAGFTREEAMSLVVADIAMMKEATKSVSAKTSASSK